MSLICARRMRMSLGHRWRTRFTTRARSFATCENPILAKKNLVPLQSAQRKNALVYYCGLADGFCEKLPGQLANELHEIVQVLESAG